ncbi:MAG: hypothetical protein AB8G86_11940 [Saprospiraceae bacterium]
MRFIKKRTNEPKALVDFKKKLHEGDTIPTDLYAALRDDDSGAFNELQEILAKEQGYVCAYCLGTLLKTIEINGEEKEVLSMKVEHFMPKSIFNGKVNSQKQVQKLCDKKVVKRADLRIEYNNLFAVCQGRSGLGETHCDTPPNGKGDKELCDIPNPSEGKAKKFDLQLRYTANFSIVSDNHKVNSELNTILNLNEEDLRKRRKSNWKAVARRITKNSGVQNWEAVGGLEVLQFASQVLEQYRQPTRNNQYFEFYDCIIYQLEKRIRAITAKL